MFIRNRGLRSLLSQWAGGGPGRLLVTDIWGLAHRPNLDGVLLCGGGSWGPSYVTILYVALHLTQLLPYLKQGRSGSLCQSQPDTWLLCTPEHTDPLRRTVDAPDSQSPMGDLVWQL